MKKNRYILILMLCFLLLCNNMGYAKNSDNFVTLSADNNSYYMICSDGGVYYMAYSDYDSESDYYDFPINDLSASRIADNGLSLSWNYILDDNHTLWRWDNEMYELEYVANNVKQVAASSTHVLFIKDDDTLWGKGSNYKGQLAQGELEYTVEEQIELRKQKNYKGLRNAKCVPSSFEQPVFIAENVIDAAAGEGFTYFLKADGSLWGVGELPDEDDTWAGYILTFSNIPEKIMDNVKNIFVDGLAAALTDHDDVLYRWGTSEIGYAGIHIEPYPIKCTDNVKSISFRPEFNYIVKNDGTLWKYGSVADNDRQGMKIMDDVNFAAGSIYGDGLHDRQMVLKNTGELYIVEFEEDSDKYSVIKFKNNIRLAGTEPIVRKYDDIDSVSDEENNAINSLSKGGTVNGTSKESFSPEKSVTRSEAAAMFLRITGKGEVKEIPNFTDVIKENWYYSIAGTSQKYGIINGYEDGTFRGDDNVSFIQFISIAARVLRNEAKVNAVADIPESVPQWASDDISLALGNGLITENELEEMLNSESVSRAKAAVILYRLYQKI